MYQQCLTSSLLKTVNNKLIVSLPPPVEDTQDLWQTHRWGGAPQTVWTGETYNKASAMSHSHSYMYGHETAPVVLVHMPHQHTPWCGRLAPSLFDRSCSRREQPAEGRVHWVMEGGRRRGERGERGKREGGGKEVRKEGGRDGMGLERQRSSLNQTQHQDTMATALTT